MGDCGVDLAAPTWISNLIWIQPSRERSPDRPYDRPWTLVRSLNELAITDTLLRDIAKLAIIGLNSRPNTG